MSCGNADQTNPAGGGPFGSVGGTPATIDWAASKARPDHGPELVGVDGGAVGMTAGESPAPVSGHRPKRPLGGSTGMKGLFNGAGPNTDCHHCVESVGVVVDRSPAVTGIA